MTKHLAPGSPPLNVGGPTPVASEPISDSAWEDLPDDGGEADTQANLRKIAKAQKGTKKQ
jgi:hypothetical protein